MIDTPQPVGTRAPVPLVVCAALGLGALAAAQLGVLGQLRAAGLATNDVASYTPVVVLVLALLAWQLSPRLSWVVLVALGAVGTVPSLVLTLAPEMFAPWMRVPYLMIDSASRPLLLVGVLGVATLVWRTGNRPAGAALLGATLVVPTLTTFVLAALIFGVDIVVPVIGLVLVLATVAATIAAAVTHPGPVEPEPGPGWRVTVAGAVAGVAPVVYRLWRGPDPHRPGGDAADYYAEAGQHALVVGLVVLGIGLLAGAVAGPRVLVAGTAGGLLLGAVSSLAGPAAQDIHDLPAGVPAVVALAAVVAGVAMALMHARMVVGVAGLGVLIVGLLVLYLVFSADEPIFGAEVTNVLTPVLLVVTVIAAVSVFASLGTVLAPAGEVPATFAGVVAAVATGVIGITTYATFSVPDDVPAILGTYPPVIVVLAIAAGLTAVAHRQWERAPSRPDAEPVGVLD